MIFKTIISLVATFFLLGAKEIPHSTSPSIPSTPTTTQISIKKPAEKTNSVASVEKNKKQTVQKTPAPIASKTPVIQTPPPIPDFTAINELARKAIVNIICTTKTNGSLEPITATGVIIDPRGIILTNAHVGQYWLIKDFRTKDFIECVIRTGSPAYPRYHAELVYISPTWVKNNTTLIKQVDPKGTGENDFSFLRITDSIDGSTLPTFSYIPSNVRETIKKNEYVDLVSYPAGFLGGLSILHDLNVTSAITTVQDYFTFKESTIDLISVGGTVVSQKGASGGAVVDKNSTLIGIITTSSNATTTNDRDLRAITMGYISRSLENETGDNLSQFLSRDMSIVARNFGTNFTPSLSKLIEDELVK